MMVSFLRHGLLLVELENRDLFHELLASNLGVCCANAS
jgi:hypothetical protein